jgi:hypothetical protein
MERRTNALHQASQRRCRNNGELSHLHLRLGPANSNDQFHAEEGIVKWDLLVNLYILGDRILDEGVRSSYDCHLCATRAVSDTSCRLV